MVGFFLLIFVVFCLFWLFGNMDTRKCPHVPSQAFKSKSPKNLFSIKGPLYYPVFLPHLMLHGQENHLVLM